VTGEYPSLPMSGGSKVVIGGHSKDISYIAGKSFSQ